MNAGMSVIAVSIVLMTAPAVAADDAENREAFAEAFKAARAARGLPPRDVEATRLKVRPAPTPCREFFVAPDGSDANPGTAERPFATFARARDAVRALPANRPVARGVEVTAKRGEYHMTETLALTAADSGTRDAPVVYRAQRKGTAVLYGGTRLRGFEPVKDPNVLGRLPAAVRDKVRQCDLKALGITDYGELRVRGIGQPPSPPIARLPTWRRNSTPRATPTS
jgi:hypothetical protein